MSLDHDIDGDIVCAIDVPPVAPHWLARVDDDDHEAHQAMPASARASVQRCCSDADLTARFMREVVPLRERLCRHAFGLTHDHYQAEDLVQEPC